MTKFSVKYSSVIELPSLKTSSVTFCQVISYDMNLYDRILNSLFNKGNSKLAKSPDNLV